MTPRTVGILLLAALVGLLLAPPGAPVGVSFVESDSMEPEMNVGDGIVLLPSGDVAPGDVVTFRSDHRDEYVTHRVVGETEAGYVTQGDNNDVTDQQAGHPPVSRDAIVASVLTLGGSPVTIPGIGTAATGIERHKRGLVAATAIALFVTGYGRTRPRRTPISEGSLVRLALAVGAVAAVVPMLVGGSAVGVTLTDAPGEDGVLLEDGRATVELETTSHPWLVSTVTARGATVRDSAWTDGSHEITLERPSGLSGTTAATLHVYQYPPMLPPSVLAALQSVHPAVAGLATTAVMYTPVVALYRLSSLPGAPLRSRSRRTGKGGRNT
ncbi:hypothetical protein GCM10027435_01230 [Haloparvum alkalitolerans]|uniref:signal peptidase I n=1 Tax=Haloparvum alkalitolerans TaxID=1042953 RepID=UPI003CEDA8FD